MKKEYYSPEIDIEIFRISSSIHTSGFGWEEEDDPVPFGNINEGEESSWG